MRNLAAKPLMSKRKVFFGYIHVSYVSFSMFFSNVCVCEVMPGDECQDIPMLTPAPSETCVGSLCTVTVSASSLQPPYELPKLISRFRLQQATVVAGVLLCFST